jgi:hypothetical protein
LNKLNLSSRVKAAVLFAKEQGMPEDSEASSGGTQAGPKQQSSK